MLYSFKKFSTNYLASGLQVQQFPVVTKKTEIKFLTLRTTVGNEHENLVKIHSTLIALDMSRTSTVEVDAIVVESSRNVMSNVLHNVGTITRFKCLTAIPVSSPPPNSEPTQLPPASSSPATSAFLVRISKVLLTYHVGSDFFQLCVSEASYDITSFTGKVGLEFMNGKREFPVLSVDSIAIVGIGDELLRVNLS
eukprot:PhF_6_TR34979/c0_g1_i1/m.50810